MGVVPRCVERRPFPFFQRGEKALLDATDGMPIHEKKEREKGRKNKK